MRESAMPLAASRLAFGVASLDTALSGGLARGRVHEIYGAQTDDAAAAAGFTMALATAMAATPPEQTAPQIAVDRASTANQNGTARMVLWLRVQRAARLGGVVQANGWAELGGMPDYGLVGVVPDAMALLRAAADALRCAALGAVVVESWGAMRELDLTASRRLTLAAEKSGVPLLLLRHDATAVPSAAQTRWQVAAAPSRALPGNAPGRPAFAVTLLRQRSGPCGLDWRLEWDRDQRKFFETALSGAVVSVSARRPAADRRIGSASRHAA